MSTQMTEAEFAQDETAHIETGLIKQLNTALDSARTNYPIIVEKVEKAKMALSGIRKIETKEQDAAAEQILVKVRATYDLAKALRMEITGPTDAIKEAAMMPEKEISNQAADSGNEYFRVKALRDAFLKEQVRIENEQKAAAEAERLKGIEFARLKAEFETRFFNKVVELSGALRQSLSAYVGTITLATFDEAKNRLSVKPNIKRDIFESWFAVQSTLPAADLNKFLSDVRAQYTYEVINEKYLLVANPILKEYQDQLPELKTKLESIAQMNEAQAAEETRKLNEAREIELANKALEDKKAIEDNATAATDAANMESLNATFQAQLVLQSVPTSKGLRKRVAIVNCEPKDIVKVFAGVLLACFQSPEFGGHVKRNKQGMPLPPDEDGVPQYEKWAEQLLSFYAEHTDKPLPGIEFIEKVSSVARKAKA